MKIVVFGTGEYYENRKDRLEGLAEIYAFLDNDSNLWGKSKEGKLILEPAKVLELSFDAVVLMAVKAYEMRKQLLNLGVDATKIFYFEQFYGYVNRDRVYTYGGEQPSNSGRGRIAILTTEMNYNGGSLAVIQAAYALKKCEYDVTIVTPEINVAFRNEMVKKGYRFFIYPNLTYASIEEMSWLDAYSGILVNTLQMIQCAVNIAKNRKVIWWIHEYHAVYEKVYNEFAHINETNFENIDIYAVSKRGKDIFHEFYPNKEIGILPLGIEDTYNINKRKKTDNGKIIFSIIGNVTLLKSQVVFLEAVQKLTSEEKEKAEFWIIGNVPDSLYADKVRKIAEAEKSVKILGQKTRDEMKELYSRIDVVVCASIEETFSLVIMEGMMYECIGVTTDTTGVAEYIEDGVSGFICKNQNIEALSERFSWIMKHLDAVENIKKEARKLYEKYFTVECLGKSLENAIIVGKQRRTI